MSKTFHAVDEFGVDVVVCVQEEGMYHTVQMIREEIRHFEGGSFWMLSDKQRSNASKLALDANVCRFSIAIGAAGL